MPPTKDPWSDQFIRNMIVKGSLTPPRDGDDGLKIWHLPLLVLGIGVAVCAAFLYGVLAR